MPDTDQTDTLSQTACGLDIGSNTISFTELKRTKDGFQVINDASIAVRLSEDLVPGGRLKPTAVARSLAAIQELETRYDLANKPVRVIGTAVLRMAGNPEAFTSPATRILGRKIDIITGEQEALLVSKGAVLGLDRAVSWTVVDVGGQSIEVCWSSGSTLRPVSLPTGVVELTRRFLTSDPPLPSEVDGLKHDIRERFASAVPRDIRGPLLAVAGTATSLGALELKLDRWQPERLHGFAVRRERLGHWIREMLAIDADQRTERYGIRPKRADVFPAGLCVLAELMDLLGRTEITISTHGLRVGAALEMLKGTENGAWTRG